MQYIGEVYSVNCEEAQIRIEAYSVIHYLCQNNLIITIEIYLHILDEN